jgi:hypothetical protein
LDFGFENKPSGNHAVNGESPGAVFFPLLVAEDFCDLERSMLKKKKKISSGTFFSAENFSVLNVMIKNLHNLALLRVKKAIFRQLFWRNYFKIITSVPSHLLLSFLFSFASLVRLSGFFDDAFDFFFVAP